MIGAGGCGIRSAQDAKNSTVSGTAGTLIIFDSFTVFPLIDFCLAQLLLSVVVLPSMRDCGRHPCAMR